MKPRRLLLGGSFVLMIVNRASGLVLPGSTKPLIDKVMYGHQMRHAAVDRGHRAVRDDLQGVTSYALTQLLSKAGQRLIAELRMQVQAHIGRLPVAFYDENRTGTLVARIMTDVEGVRNLIGTGVVDFVGGVLTAMFAFCYLITLSVQMTLLTFVILVLFALILQKAFKTIRPIFRERAKINAEVTGRLTESLGGVRVVKGYHAEDSEAKVFASGRAAAAGERDQFADGAVADEPGVDGGAGRGGRADHVPGRAPGACGQADAGRLRDVCRCSWRS